ncbi:MAG: protein kinase, partial [bacterium]
MIGKTVLHYEILDKLGEGGMGVVYKAEDTKLERTVALKFLSLTSIGDDEKKRFKREAKAAASLNHPNIATIFAIDEAEGQTFIAMEFIEGQSVEEIVGADGGKPMPIDAAIDYATQTAAGLQAAHEKGVTHRDIKSANIMVTDKGVVKIMDFGLAKLANRSKMTQLGTTLGTAAYMSPEQARGEDTDHRADIWSLGVVLYEMISGQMPFKGDYEQAVIYSIQNEDPEPLTALRTGVPIALDGIITKALAKDPKTRYQHVDELPADLKAIDIGTLSKSRIATKPSMPIPIKLKRSLLLSWVMTGLMTLLAAGLWYGWRATSADQPATGVKRAILPLTPSDGLDARFAISPDGTMLVFEGRSGARNQLFLRYLNREEAVALPGTEDGSAPFFSPDGKWIGFRTLTTLKKVSVDGGSPIVVCEAQVREASWGTRNEIVFSQTVTSTRPWELMSVSAQGGLPEPIPTDESDTRQARWPQVLPDGRHVMFTSGYPVVESVVVQSIESGEKRTLIQEGANPRYVPTGHIIFIGSGDLMAVPFDLKTLTITGPASPLSEDIYTGLDAYESFTVSMEGTLIYRSEEANRGRGLIWFDRQGAMTPVAAPANVYWDPRLSPNGQRVAINMPGEDIWIFELTRGALTRFTFGPATEETQFWSPDGRWLAFASSGADQPITVFRKRADGSGALEPLWTSEHHTHVECWSTDGHSILVTNRDPNMLDDIWLIRLDDEISARPLLQTQFTEFGGRISPDGVWFAYTSDESGRNEVYIQAFPDLGDKVQVSTNGGSQPVWAPNGKELFYRDADHVMAVSVVPGKEFAVTSPKQLFSDQYTLRVGRHTTYDVSKDGKRFLMIQSDAQGRTSLNVVFNWFEEVRRLAP